MQNVKTEQSIQLIDQLIRYFLHICYVGLVQKNKIKKNNLDFVRNILQ